jgi:hypothetical protein
MTMSTTFLLSVADKVQLSVYKNENRQQVLLELTADAASGSMEGEKSSPR